MYKSYLYSLILCSIGLSASAQLDLAALDFYVGTGSDTTALVIDFKDGSFDSSYTWGYLYSGSKTGEDLLHAVAAADQNLLVNVDTASFGNFLQDIQYIQHEGLGGLPDYWSTWDGLDMASLVSNNGIATSLVSGGVFGVSYTDFNPAIAPGNLLKAYNPADLDFGMIDTWVGNGTDSLIMIIDFSDSTDTTSFAWGYLFSDSVSYLTVLNDLDAADSQLSVTISGAVLNITYRGLSGMIGAVSDWYVWEAENFGNWRLRYAEEIYLHPGDFGAVVFTRFLQPVRPILPVNINQSIGIGSYPSPTVNIYPNPVSDQLIIEGEFKIVQVYAINGNLVASGVDNTLDLSVLNSGWYVVKILLPNGMVAVKKVIRR